MAGLRHLRTLPAPAGPAGVQHAGGPARGHVHPVPELVACVRAAVRRRRPEHVLHRHRVRPAVPGEREAPGRAAAPVGAHRAQPEARVRGAAVSEVGGAGPSPRSAVRAHRVATFHPAAAADDTGLSGQLKTITSSDALSTFT